MGAASAPLNGRAIPRKNKRTKKQTKGIK